MELREVIARALCASESGSTLLWDELTSFDRIAFKRDAQASLDAITEAGFVIVPREPTKEMLKAGARRSPPHGTYCAMIAAATEQQSPSPTD